MSGPVTLITGGAGGIGAAAAALLLRRGHRVAVTGRDPERLERFADRTGGDRLLTAVARPDDESDTAAAVDAALAAFGRLDHVVANAGLSTHDTVAEGDPREWRRMLLANVLGPAVLIRAALPELRRTRGRIVLLGSVAGVKHSPGNVYSVTKWSVSALAENTRMQVTADGVGVSLIAPGRVDTPFWDSRPGGRPDGPALTPEQVAECIGWVLGQPEGVDVNTVLVRPTGQLA